MFKESEKIELKETFAEWKEIIISLVAFANRIGGKIIVGVNDSGEFTNLIVGKNSIEDFVNKVKQHTDPVLYPSINVNSTLHALKLNADRYLETRKLLNYFIKSV